MIAVGEATLTEFGGHVLEGLSSKQKYLSARYFYDDLGSALFEAITLLPEYGLTRADERLLTQHAGDIASLTGEISTVCELGSGSGKKTRSVLQALTPLSKGLIYSPIDVSSGALAACQRELEALVAVVPICADWNSGLTRASKHRQTGKLLLMFLGSSIGNLERAEIPKFLSDVRHNLRSGDFFLLGVDLLKDLDVMLTAYDDPTGVTAAFNLNVLGRMNRELAADFNLRAFEHQASWNEQHRRIEMHLVSKLRQQVPVAALNSLFHFEQGETIWTESSHKFTVPELEALGIQAGFRIVSAWIDEAWPFAEVLWQVP